MSDLSQAERKAFQAVAFKTPTWELREATWLAARDYLNETVIVPLGVRLNDAERDRETAEDRIRVLEEALEAEWYLVAGEVRDLPRHVAYTVWADKRERVLYKRLDAMHRALSTSVGSSDAHDDVEPVGSYMDATIAQMASRADEIVREDELASDAGANSDAGKLRHCPVCLGPLDPDDEGPECDPSGCPGRSEGDPRV